ncbi:anti-sigma factor family protein [Arthrobacter roseus]|uniref:anti-sigma factor family protein n=1 Tax=Arthrobacter roseus TaxID=136274 RepID=UPI001964AF2C|nr:zf-HC2 domain-containing protein [Arthrobacter roseus]MBM7849186.1 hypothetical protein [Arthrobacter roseus]
MGHPQRHLAAFIDGELPPKVEQSIQRHISHCKQCRAIVEFQRGIRSRLRSPVPRPAQDLTASILARTNSSAHQGPSESAWGHAAAAHGRPSRRRLTVATTVAIAVIATGTLTGAYVMGAEPAPVASLDHQQAIASGWEAVAHDTPTKLLVDQVNELRSEGWNCPDLEAIGFSLTDAEAITVRGTPTVRLTLSNGEDSLTVYEQRKISSVRAADAPPVNAVTGNEVTSDGFERMGGTQRELWVNPDHSWQVVLDADAVTYTVMSSTSPAEMPAAIQQVVHTEQAQLTPDPDMPANDPFHRVVRGLQKMAQLDDQ